MSPYSVATALALAGQGASGNTFEQVKSVLHLTGDKDSIADNFNQSVQNLKTKKGGSTLDVANKIYVKNGFQIKSKFEEYAVKKFDSEVQSLEFTKNIESAKTINNWVEGKTNNKIINLIDAGSLNEDTRIVLVNAIYFKGKWQNEFNKNRTAIDKFYTNENKFIETEFMHAKDYFNYANIDELDATALELKYADSDISFIIILPNKRDGLNALEEKLSNYDISGIKEKMEEFEVDVTIPKFKIEYQVELVDTLKKVWSIVFEFVCE